MQRGVRATGQIVEQVTDGVLADASDSGGNRLVVVDMLCNRPVVHVKTSFPIVVVVSEKPRNFKPVACLQVVPGSQSGGRQSGRNRRLSYKGPLARIFTSSPSLPRRTTMSRRIRFFSDCLA